jgi:acetoacetyl-CoA synthetase
MQAIWRPSLDVVEGSNINKLIDYLRDNNIVDAKNYRELWQWSVEHTDVFWKSVWEFSEIRSKAMGESVFVTDDEFYKARFFPESQLNFAENYLRRTDDETAITFWGEDKVEWVYSFRELYDLVSQTAQAMQGLGLKKGDVVAAYMPNLPHTIIAMLAATSLGAIFTSASPDFGVSGLLDRFSQVKPKLLITCDGYFYKGKVHSLINKVPSLISEMASIEKVIVVNYAGDENIQEQDKRFINFETLISSFSPKPIEFEYLDFDHPVYILYSSGTTGVPKCIVHRAGGVLLKHASELLFHADVKYGDCMYYFTTCGWMMWNWSISSLLCGASLALYDGSPFVREGNIQFDLIDEVDATHWGTSPKFLQEIDKVNLKPADSHRLEKLRVIVVAGSPLMGEQFDYVYNSIKKDVHLNSISGGTDLIGIFMGGAITEPLFRGEMQVPALGMDTQIFDENGKALPQGVKGELVCTKPFPSIPLGFKNDKDDKRFKEAYFNTFKGVWHHGDFAMITENNGFIIFGRSDATLNPGGVRIGTAEIYLAVDKMGEVLESCVIGQQWPPETKEDTRVVLFVHLRENLTLDEKLEKKIRTEILQRATPRHVPAKIIEVREIPRTISGKIVELAVQKIIHGEEVKNRDALLNPDALNEYINIKEELWKS